MYFFSQAPRLQTTVKTVTNYFNNLYEEIDDIPACNIYHYYKTNFTDDPSRKKVQYDLKSVEKKMEDS